MIAGLLRNSDGRIPIQVAETRVCSSGKQITHDPSMAIACREHEWGVAIRGSNVDIGPALNQVRDNGGMPIEHGIVNRSPSWRIDGRAPLDEYPNKRGMAIQGRQGKSGLSIFIYFQWIGMHS